MLCTPQGPRHSPQGDQADQLQLTVGTNAVRAAPAPCQQVGTRAGRTRAGRVVAAAPGLPIQAGAEAAIELHALPWPVVQPVHLAATLPWAHAAALAIQHQPLCAPAPCRHHRDPRAWWAVGTQGWNTQQG